MKLKLGIFIIFIFINSLVYIFTEDIKDKKIERALQLHTQKLQDSYKTYKYEQELTSYNMLSIIERSTMQYLKKIPSASYDELSVLRQNIYQALLPSYTRIKNKGLYQLQFVLPNNKSFLRMHKPEKFDDDLSGIRYSIVYVNKTKKSIQGFEPGKTNHGYRYVYPIFDERGDYICAVEIAFSSSHLQNYFTTIMNLHTPYLINESVFYKKEWKRDDKELEYLKSAENPEYKIVMTKDHTIQNCITNNKEKLSKYKNLIKSNMDSEKPFTIYVKHSNVGNYKSEKPFDLSNEYTEVISFKPIHSTDDKALSWIVSYSKDSFIKDTIDYTISSRIVIFILLAFMFYFLYKNIKQRIKLLEKTKEQAGLLTLFDKGDSVLFKWRNDKNWSVEYVSKSVTKLLGYTQEEFLKGDILYADCIDKNDIQTIIKELEDVSKSEKNYLQHRPYKLITKTGELKWVLDYTATIRDNDGNITHYIGYITNITQTKENERLMAEQSKLAAMGEMIGNIAHQWRQPLSVISTGATGLKLGKEYDALSDEFFYKTCDMINDNAQYLSKTIDDFRSFIKGDRKKTQFNIADDIESFLHLVEGSIKNYDIKVIKDFEENITIYGYPNELIQCFINIFNNSKDALKNMENEKLFFISTTLKNDNIVISFKDNGGGIDKDILPHIFEPYFTTKHKSKGTGLGLSMTYNLITNGMNGTIKADNVKYVYNKNEYIGASFEITVPLS